MLTKTEIKKSLLQLQKDLASFTPLLESRMKTFQEKNQAIERRYQQITVQNNCEEKEGYELKLPIYSLYISYLQSIRELGFLVFKIRDFNLRSQAIINAINRLVRRIDRFFPNNEAALQTRLEFAQIAMNCERTTHTLGGVVGTLIEEMYSLAQQYVKNKNFKAGIDAELSSLEAIEQRELWEWCKPWVESFIYTSPPETSPLDIALATLVPEQTNNSVSVFCN